MFSQALQDDASAIFLDSIRNVGDEPRRAAAYPTRVSTTLYDRRYLTMIMDEAHTARKLNKIHTAACALRSISSNLIAMTATPVMTKLQVSTQHFSFPFPLFLITISFHIRMTCHFRFQDLWIMGHFMGIQQFSDKVAYDAMTKELNRAQAKDRKAERESENAADHLRKLLSGKDSHDLNKTEFYPKLQKYIPQLREAFSHHVIRRTLDSVDHQGRRIFGMRPYLEHVMLIELRDWEKSELNALTNEIVERSPPTTLVGTGKVSLTSCPFDGSDSGLVSDAEPTGVHPIRSGTSRSPCLHSLMVYPY